MKFRYCYSRMNITTGEITTAYRDFEDVGHGGFVTTMIMFLNFLNDHNKIAPGVWQYWANDLRPIHDENKG